MPNEPKPTRTDLTQRKLELNLRRNRAQSQGEGLEGLAADFRYEDCKDQLWNPEPLSLLWGTPLWEQASAAQRLALNHLYWVAYYSQIISAEIATIFFNQTSAAGLYTIDEFRIVCDTLDLETSQERSHIATFKAVAEAVEQELVGGRLFTYPMRPYYVETVIFQNAGRLRRLWKRFQLQSFGLVSSGNAFLASQYLTVRGMRTLNGKLVQHRLSRYAQELEPEHAPVPARISHAHFLDESFHFNTSSLIGLELVQSLPAPTRFERWATNQGITGCQRDHYNVSTVLNGIFWYDPATFQTIYRLLRGPLFGMDQGGALQMLEACFCRESDGLHASFETHEVARQSYVSYIAPLSFVTEANKQMQVMGSNTIAKHLEVNRRAMARFQA